MKYRISFNCVTSGRLWSDENIDYFEQSKYGFYWWIWLPEYHTNGGKFKKAECADVCLVWLCFSLGLTFWPRMY